MSSIPKREEHLATRMRPSEKQRVRKACVLREERLSEFVRRVALREADRVLEGRDGRSRGD